MANGHDASRGCICPDGCLLGERVNEEDTAGLTRVKCTNAAKCIYSPIFLHNNCFEHWQDNLMKTIIKNHYRGKDWTKKEVERSLWTSERPNSGFKFVWRFCKCPCGGILKKDIDAAPLCDVQKKSSSSNGPSKPLKSKLPNIPSLNSPKKLSGPSVVTAPGDIADRFGETTKNGRVRLPVGLQVALPTTFSDTNDKAKPAKAKPVGYTAWQVVGKDGRPKSTVLGETTMRDPSICAAPPAPRSLLISGGEPWHEEARSTPSPELKVLRSRSKQPVEHISSSTSTSSTPANPQEADEDWHVVSMKRKSRDTPVEVSSNFVCKPIPLNKVKVPVPEWSVAFAAPKDPPPASTRWSNEETKPPHFLRQSTMRKSVDAAPPGFSARRNSNPENLWRQSTGELSTQSQSQLPTSFDDSNMNDLVRELENVDMLTSSSDEAINNAYPPGLDIFDNSGRQTRGSGAQDSHISRLNDIQGHLVTSESGNFFKYRQSYVQLIELIALYDTSFEL